MIKLALLDVNNTVACSDEPRGYFHPKYSYYIVPGAYGSIKRLYEYDWKVAFVTMQPQSHMYGDVKDGDIARILNCIVEDLVGDMEAELYVCYHSKTAGCDCRKPKPLLLELATKHANADITWMIGDSWKDIQAANDAGIYSCRLVLPNSIIEPGPVPTIYAGSLDAATLFLVGNS